MEQSPTCEVLKQVKYSSVHTVNAVLTQKAMDAICSTPWAPRLGPELKGERMLRIPRRAAAALEDGQIHDLLEGASVNPS
jgi:hypothetical protein